MNISARHRYILLATVAYAVLALAWIFLSDWLLLLFLDIEAVVWMSMVKGVFFVLVSAGIFCFVLQAVPPGEDLSGTLPANTLPAGQTARMSPRWLTYGYAVALVAAMLLVRINLPGAFEEHPLLILFMLPTIVAALLGGFGPGMTVTLAIAAIALYKLPPAGSFTIVTAHDLFQWSLLIVNGVTVSLISEVMHRSRHREQMRSQQLDAANAELRQSEDRYRTLFENSLDAILLTIPDGRVLSANPAACRMFGRTEEEICVLGRAALVDTGDPRLAVLLEERARTGKAFGELTFFHKDGSRFPAEVSSVIFKDTAGHPRSSMIIRDVAVRREAETELREKELQYRNLADGGLALIWTAGTDKLCNYFNQRWLEFTGRTLEQELGNGWTEGVHPDDFDRCLDVYVTAFDRRERFEMEYRLQRADGEYRWILDMGTPTYNSIGKFVGYIGHCFDITEQKTAEQERQRLISELEKRNGELERFTYTVSHDLKSPLVTILGFVGQLEQDLADNDRENIKADLDFIGGAASQMSELLDSLLQLSRAGRSLGDLHPVDLAALTREAIDLLGDRLAHARLKIDFSAAPPVVPGDSIRLFEVFQNLLGNAAKFTVGQPDPCIEVGCTAGTGALLCHVRDNGIGIPAAYHEKVFGLFEQLHAGSGGTGIGLAIVRRIVEEHGGRIWVESAGVGQGSTFFFTLPVKSLSQ